MVQITQNFELFDQKKQNKTETKTFGQNVDETPFWKTFL